ncbi:MAG: hypothetical protein AB8B57_04680 [Congregibacter sp.]
MCIAKRVTASVIVLLASGQVQAWSDHANLVWPLLRTMPTMQQNTLLVEPLEDFLQAQAPAIRSLLADKEAQARRTWPNYAPRPDKLAFRVEASDLRGAFLTAIRVNPTLSYGLYRQTTVEDVQATLGRPLRRSELNLLAADPSNAVTDYVELQVGDRVSPAHVLASGSDEPDFGMDVGLFADNNTEFGADYGFGLQPFGNPNLPYGSQAPMHMGFYHLDWITRTAQPSLLRTYPEWRIDLFRALARLAFDTGHAYWGWRFSGWGLHYIGDLTQPYHAEPLPGVGTPEALWLVARGKTDEIVQLVSNRHGVLESYQYQRVTDLLAIKDWKSPVLSAIASAAQNDEEAFDASTVRDVLTRHSVEAGARLDAVLVEYMPARYVADPDFEWTGSGEESDLIATLEREKSREAVAALDAALVLQLRRFSRFARMWVDDARRTYQQAKSP